MTVVIAAVVPRSVCAHVGTRVSVGRLEDHATDPRVVAPVMSRRLPSSFAEQPCASGCFSMDLERER